MKIVFFKCGDTTLDSKKKANSPKQNESKNTKKTFQQDTVVVPITVPEINDG